MITVWNELKLRCRQKELAWEDCPVGSEADSVIWSQADHKALLITSWAYVLDGLLDATQSGGHDGIRRDILQLRDLTNRMDSEAFLPIRADEISDQETAHRLINYGDLIEDIVQYLIDIGLADIQGLRPTHGWYASGRYIKVHGHFGL